MLAQSSRTIDRYVRKLAVERGWRPGTDVEDRVALALSRCGWKPAEVAQQHPLLGYRLDFAWPAVAVCLEADGWYHRSLDVIDRDRRRDADLRAAGWWTFRVDWTADEHSLMLQVGKVSRLVRTMMLDAKSWSAEEWRMSTGPVCVCDHHHTRHVGQEPGRPFLHCVDCDCNASTVDTGPPRSTLPPDGYPTEEK